MTDSIEIGAPWFEDFHVGLEFDAPAVTLTEQPFFVEQSKGSSLGYTIMPYDPAGAHKGKEPNLLAFRVPLDGSAKSMRFRALDAKGEVLAGSEIDLAGDLG